MSATYEQAVDDILTFFKDAWDATGYTAIYPNIGGDAPTTVAPWARVTLQHILPQGQASLSGALGTQRYERNGILTVQIFTPLGEGLAELYQLSKIVTDAFDGKATPLHVWFRNARVSEVGPSGHWYQVNVLVDFTYDEIK